MDITHLTQLLDSFKEGKSSRDDVLAALKKLPFEELGYASVDHHRALRTGFPEVIFCQGKTPAQAAGIAQRLIEAGAGALLATRADRAHYEAIRALVPSVEYHELPRLVTLGHADAAPPPLPVCVVTAGTADMPVAEEAAIVAESLGNRVDRVYDVGVAGIHRLFARLDTISKAGVIIVAAGMEGALASVVGGLVDRPIVALPTSIGYGASFGGLSALLTMLNSCASGIGVVNIDNGFGAAWLANKINRSNLH